MEFKAKDNERPVQRIDQRPKQSKARKPQPEPEPEPEPADGSEFAAELAQQEQQ